MRVNFSENIYLLEASRLTIKLEKERKDKIIYLCWNAKINLSESKVSVIKIITRAKSL